MNKISITQINLNNPLLSTYTKRINSWKNGKVLCDKLNDNKDNFFYGIFYDEHFLAASTMNYNDENSTVNISMANGSINHFNEIEDASFERLSEIAIKKYGSKKINFN